MDDGEGGGKVGLFRKWAILACPTSIPAARTNEHDIRLATWTADPHLDEGHARHAPPSASVWLLDWLLGSKSQSEEISEN